MDLGLTMALGALFVAGSVTWGIALARERSTLIAEAQERLEQIAQQVQDDARCVELFADRILPGGSEFYLIAPPGIGEARSDTLARYRVHTAGPDTMLQRSRFPIERTAALRIHVLLDFLLPMEVADTGMLAGSRTEVHADRNMLCADVHGRRMELVDTTLLSLSLTEVLSGPAYKGAVALILDTVASDTLYHTAAPSLIGASAPTVRTNAIVQQDLAPWVLVLALPAVTAAAFQRTVPFLVLFLVLFGSLVFTLWRSRRAWLQQQRLAAMQLDLVSNITHEFNTPLTHISLALDALLRRDHEATDRHMLDVIGEENQRMQANVKKVMAVSVLDKEGLPMELELHDAHELLRATLRSLGPALEKESVALTCAFEATDPWVLVDATYLVDVFHSILDNAIKYGHAPKQVAVITSNGNGGLTIRFDDTGPGIPTDERELVFSKFYRGTNGRETGVKGTGIGLYFARKVVQAHRGTVRSGESPSGGTRIEIQLPQEKHG